MNVNDTYQRFKTLAVHPGHIIRAVELTFKSATAKTVALIGDFGSSCSSPLPMSRDERGIWQIQLQLAPGCYHYQFVVDGTVWDDPGACSTNPRRLGVSRCALRVE
jgi:1,4-alpha-glucan branching enzyme